MHRRNVIRQLRGHKGVPAVEQYSHRPWLLRSDTPRLHLQHVVLAKQQQPRSQQQQ